MNTSFVVHGITVTRQTIHVKSRYSILFCDVKMYRSFLKLFFRYTLKALNFAMCLITVTRHFTIPVSSRLVVCKSCLSTVRLHAM